MPRYLLDRYPDVEPNVLRVGLRRPYVRLATTLNAPDQRAENRELELNTTSSRRTPYANLILEMLSRDPTLSIRGDEAEEAWRIVNPVTKAWSAGEVPMQEYGAGETPPGPRL